MKQDQILAGIIGLCCVAAIGWICRFANWEAVLFDGESYYGIDLPVSSIWRSPDLPTYSEFRRTHDLRSVPKQPFKIEAVVRWFYMAERFIWMFWGITILCEVLCLMAPELRSNVVLRCFSTLAYSLTVAFAMSIVFWFVFGGWGPPNPLPFAFCGIVGGGIREGLLLRQKQSL